MMFRGYVLFKKIVGNLLLFFYAFFYRNIYCEIEYYMFLIKHVLGVVKEDIYKGNCILTDRICIFAGYLPLGRVNDLLINYLQNIKDANYSIVLVLNGKVSEDSLKLLKPLCVEIVARPNMGRDFGAYKYGITSHEAAIKKSSRLLLVNDTCCLVRNIAHIFKEMEVVKCDWWGVSELYHATVFSSINYHLASYFLEFKETVLSSEGFWRYWHDYKPKNSKKHAVLKGEIQFSKKLSKMGFNYGCYSNDEHLYKMAINSDLKELNYLPAFNKEMKLLKCTSKVENLTLWYKTYFLPNSIYSEVKKFAAHFTLAKQYIAHSGMIKKTFISDAINTMEIHNFVRESAEYDPELIISELKKNQVSRLQYMFKEM